MSDQASLPMAQAIKVMKSQAATIKGLEERLKHTLACWKHEVDLGNKSVKRADKLQEIAKSEHDACVATIKEAHDLRRLAGEILTTAMLIYSQVDDEVDDEVDGTSAPDVLAGYAKTLRLEE